MSFIDEIKRKAAQNKKTIVLPESEDPRILEAANIIIKENIARIILIGNNNDISKVAKERNFTYLNEAQYISIEDKKYDKFVDSLCEIRKHKNLTKDAAIELLKNPLYFGVMLVKHGFADGMVAGATHTSGETLLPAVQIIKMTGECKKASSFFIMITPNGEYGYNGALLLADCGLVPNPDSEQLSDIAILSAKTFSRFFNIHPKTAFLSYSTYGSAKGESIDKIKEAISLSRSKEPNLIFDGEFQMDAAIIPEVNRIKAPNSIIKGDANVLIFPDVNSGNLVYKTIERFGHAEAYGPITQGLSKPVNDLSRGCKVQDIVGVIAITAVQAQMES